MATQTKESVLGVFDIDEEVLTLALARMVDSFGNSFLIVVLPLYIASGAVSGDAFGLGTSLVTGVILSAFGFFNSALQPFTGRASDRLGRRKAFVLVGLGVLAVANFAYSFVGSYVFMLLVRALQDIGVAFTVPATVALVNELSASDSRGGNMGAFNTFRITGFAAGPLVAGTVVGMGPYGLGGFRFSGFDAAFYIAALGAATSFTLAVNSRTGSASGSKQPPSTPFPEKFEPDPSEAPHECDCHHDRCRCNHPQRYHDRNEM